MASAAAWSGPHDLPHGEGHTSVAKDLHALIGFGKTKYVRAMSVANVAWPGQDLLKATAVTLPPDDLLPDLKEGSLLDRSQ